MGSELHLGWEDQISGDVRIGPLPWTINLGPTIDPSDRVYLTSNQPGCRLRALDGRTGAVAWCDADLDQFVVVSSPLIDRQGHVFVADGAGMHGLDPAGHLIWTTPLAGVPFSAQFTPDGRLVFVTNVGTVYVLDRLTGRPVVAPLALAPGVSWQPSDGLLACAQGTAACPSANTPAVDHQGRLIFTYWAPGAPSAGVTAVQYVGGTHPRLARSWSDDALPGGSASSPALSFDGRRVYVTSNAGSLVALDTRTGATVWNLPIGYAAGGSVSVSPAGVIMPAGGRDSPVIAVRDGGDHAVVLWRRDDLQNRGIATQAAGGKAYVTVSTGPLTTALVVLDTTDGRELGRVALPGTSVFSVGTTVGPHGTVFVPSIVGNLYALVPAHPMPAAPRRTPARATDGHATASDPRYRQRPLS